MDKHSIDVIPAVCPNWYPAHLYCLLGPSISIRCAREAIQIC